MATAVLTNVPTTISLAESTTGWNGDSFSLEPDIKVQGSNSIACAQTNSGINDLWYAGSWDLTGGEHLRLWMNSSYVGAYGQPESLDGIQVYISDGTNTAYWTVGGSDTYGGGWTQLVVYTGSTPTSGTVPAGNTTEVGIRINTHSKPRNVPANMWVDAWYYGDGYTITGGTSGDEIDWSHVAALDYIEAYGIVQRLEDVYFMAGDVTMGNGATTTYFKSGQKIQFKDLPVLSTLYSVTFEGSGTNVDISGGSYGAAGIQNYIFNASDINLNAFTLTGVQYANSSGISYQANATVTGSIFDNCLQIVPSTSIFNSHSISNSIATDGSLLFPITDANINGLVFVNCDNAVEYDINSDQTTPAFNDFTFDDEIGNFDVNNTSGSAATIYLTNGSNANSYTGSLVTFVANPVTTYVTAVDTNGSPLADINVRLQSSDNAGDIPYQESVTITSSGTVATVTHNLHNMATGDYMFINGANEPEYNQAHQITVLDVNSYTYTIVATTSPATGTITATGYLIYSTTDGTGLLSDTRTFSIDQNVTGVGRKGSTAPYYQQGTINGTISAATGASFSVVMVSDE